MKEPSRMPQGGLKALEAIIEQVDIADDVRAWLVWTHEFLTNRKMYHKKTQVKTALLRKMAETLLSPDELAAIDTEAEKQL